MEKLGLLGSFMYETNPVLLAANAIGYPLAATGTVLDFELTNGPSLFF
jgi:hypothetical protein